MKEPSPYASVRLPLSLRKTSLDTSELKVVKLFHLSGSPGSWTLYNILNFAYPLLPHFKFLFTGIFTSAITVCRKRFQHNLDCP